MSNKRKIDLLVLSDVHLGTYGCRADELLQYLKSVKPTEVILNGDIIDVWQFSKNYWPSSHMKIVKHFIGWASKGVKVHYICGNHDELFRKFENFEVGNLSIKNKLVRELDGRKAWIFHGDVFDVTMQHSRWLAKLGAVGYDTLILLNSIVNSALTFFGQERISFSKKIKNKVKGAVKFINNFEQTAIDLAASKGYDYVICGHIHRPEMKDFIQENGKRLTYLNSGDWVEHMSALEWNDGSWSLYEYKKSDFEKELDEEEYVDESTSEIFNKMLVSFLQ